jgi:hypothetical protein
MVVDQQCPSGIAVIVDMNHATVAGPNVKLTRLRDRSLHARNIGLGHTDVNAGDSTSIFDAWLVFNRTGQPWLVATSAHVAWRAGSAHRNA